MSSSPTSSLGRTFQPTSSDVTHHSCGCTSKGVSRLQSASGDLRSLIGQGDSKVDAIGTVLDIAVIGGAAYLVYKLFFD